MTKTSLLSESRCGPFFRFILFLVVASGPVVAEASKLNQEQRRVLAEGSNEKNLRKAVLAALAAGDDDALKGAITSPNVVLRTGVLDVVSKTASPLKQQELLILTLPASGIWEIDYGGSSAPTYQTFFRTIGVSMLATQGINIEVNQIRSEETRQRAVAVLKAGTLAAPKRDAVDPVWIREVLRTEVKFDKATLLPYDRKTGRGGPQPDGDWPKVRLEMHGQPVGFELRMARFRTEAEAREMVELLRALVPSGGAEDHNRPMVGDHTVFFGESRILVRRKNVVFELFADRPATIGDLFTAARMVIEQVEPIRAEMPARRTR